MKYVNMIFNHHLTVNTIPSLRELRRYVTPDYAAQWRMLGTLLGLHTERLEIIEHDNFKKAMPCCNAMLSKWLEIDTTPTWKKLLTVIKSLAKSKSGADKGD